MGRPPSDFDIELQLLVDAIYLKYHFDFRGYAQASLKRRVQTALDRLGCRTPSQCFDSSTGGSPTITTTTPTAGSACAPPGSSSELTHPPPRVRFDGGNTKEGHGQRTRRAPGCRKPCRAFSPLGTCS